MSASRYIPHSNQPPSDLGVVQEDVQDALISNVRRVQRHTAARNGVYIGSSGTCSTLSMHQFTRSTTLSLGVYVMDKSVAGFVPSDLSTSSVTLLMSKQLSVPPSGSRASFLETSVGPATLTLKERIWVGSGARSASVNKSDLQKLEEFWQPCAQLLEAAIQVSISEEIDDDGCEVLYGRAGLLYALLLLRTELASLRDGGMSISQTEDPAVRAVASLCSDANVQALVDDIMKRGRVGAREYQEELASLRDERDKVPPLMWRWHVSRYLGGAHGVGESYNQIRSLDIYRADTAGILHMLVMAPSNITTTYWPDIVGMVEWLLAIQGPLGNWPSKAGRHLYYVAGGTATSQEAKRVSVGKDDQHELLQ